MNYPTSLFSSNLKIEKGNEFGGEISIAGCSAKSLATEFGSPLFVIDQADFYIRTKAWRDSLNSAFGGGNLYYAAKSFISVEVAKWLMELKVNLDVCTGGELAVGFAANFPSERIEFHGNNKSVAEIVMAIKAGVGTIVIDSFIEIDRVAQIAKAAVGTGGFGTFMFIMVQLATMLILFAGANTTYSAFPLLVNFVATDGYLPRQLTKRGHRLAFSNGILLLAGGGSFLVLITAGSVEHLVAFYALGVFTGFTLAGFGMTRYFLRTKPAQWKLKVFINALAGSVSLIIVIIFSVVKFTEGAWLVLVTAPILVMTFLRLRRQYSREQSALVVKSHEERATSMARHNVTIFVDSVDIATVGAVRYARSLKPHKIKAVHFVIDDRRAEEIQRAWAESEALEDVQLDLIDCPDRRIANSALDYAIRKTEKPDVELTILLPRRSYSRFLGRLLHDQTAEEIAAPISQLERVVATIVPFDVNRITSGKKLDIHREKSEALVAPVAEKSKPAQEAPKVFAPVTHYAEDVTPIGKIEWRKRSKVHGRVTSISTAPRGSAPMLQVEVWDETGGITLNFLGRREIAGLEVGMEMRAEAMVGEEEGQLTILNPSYELLV